MRGPPVTSLVLCWAALVASCGPGVGEGFPEDPSAGDAGTDTDTDTETDTGTGDPFYEECPSAIQDDCQQEQPAMETLLAAEELGPGVTFAAMGRNSLVAARTVDAATAPLFVRMSFSEYDGVESLGLAELAEPPVSSLTPVAVVGDLNEDVFGYWGMVLAADGAGYSLLGTSVFYQETEELVALPEAGPPTTAELRGLIYLQQKVPDTDPELEQVCAFGDGLLCFDGVEWTTLIEPGSDTLVNDIGMLYFDSAYQLLAVGDGGWIAHRDGESWVELASGTDRDLLGVSVDHVRFTAAGRDGALVYGTAQEIVSCEISDTTILVLSGIPDEGVMGIFETGPVFYWELGDWGPLVCETGAEVPGALETRIVGCDASQNLFVLTEQALHGGNECMVVE
jgi:hypothetical protein